MKDYRALAAEAERKYNLPQGLLGSVITAESNWNPKARSPVGAIGIAQFMPATAKEMGIDPLDPVQAIDGAARYFAQNLKRFKGNADHAIAAYNAGPGAVQKYGGIPPYKETQGYVEKVKSGMKPQSTYTFIDDEPAGSTYTFLDEAPRQAQPVANAEPEGGFLPAVGAALMDIPLGIKQRFDQAAAGLENKFGGQGISKALGMNTARDIERATQAKVAEKRKIDAPLLKTAAGKAGMIVGKGAPALAAAFVPGGQGLAGAMLAGGGLGFVEPVVDGESVVRNAATGTAFGAAGYGAGKALGHVTNRAIEKVAAQKAANASKDAVIRNARAAGYVIPPTQSNPTLMNRALEGLAGKISTGQAASIKNQAVTNKAAARSLGLDPNQPITKDALTGLRASAGKAYEQIKGVGSLNADDQYVNALNSITQKYRGAGKDFPELAKNDIDGIIASVNKPSFGADSAVDAISILREKASAAYAGGDSAGGGAFKGAANALEDLIERNLQTQNSGMLKSFRDARQLIAKSHSVEKALNDATGNVAARKLAAQLSRGKPLSGELRDIARFAQAFPKAADEVTSSMPGLSPLDYVGAGLMGGSLGPAGLASIGLRPLARSAILSAPYQAMKAAPTYTQPITQLLRSGRVPLQAGLVSYPNWSK